MKNSIKTETDRKLTLQSLHKKSEPPRCPPPRVSLKIIYVWAECPGCVYCQEDLEELENEVEQM